jgi:hypothetical protein
MARTPQSRQTIREIWVHFFLGHPKILVPAAGVILWLLFPITFGPILWKIASLALFVWVIIGGFRMITGSSSKKKGK